MENNIYFVYILRCIDNSLYTGITTNLKRRFNEHKAKTIKSAKYTKSRQVISLEAVWQCANRSIASKLEYKIKTLTKQNKESLINNTLSLSELTLAPNQYIKLEQTSFFN